jgi:thioredoxin 1
MPRSSSQERSSSHATQRGSESGRLPARWLSPRPSHADVVELTDANFDDHVLSSAEPFLVDFWAETCVPCRMQEPTIERLAEETRGRLKVGRLSVSENPKVLETYRIRGVPHLIVVRSGEVILELVGDHSIEQLRSHLREIDIA